MSAWVLEKTLASILSPIYRFWNPVVMRIWEPQAGAHKNIFFSKNHHFGYHQTYPQNLHLFGYLYFCIMWIILINITSKSGSPNKFPSHRSF
jgi:hypothetical protein